MQYFSHEGRFELENGMQLNGFTVAYDTYGNLNDDKSNVVWVCHALTANSDAADWWSGLVGAGCLINPEKYFIVCANILGSCYGSTGPLSLNAATGRPFFSQFPTVTIRDMVKAHMLLREYLRLDRIYLAMGGSMGGYQILEWCLMETDRIENIFLVGTSATESAWGIAVHTAQRLAIEADSSWRDDSEAAGKKGLRAARAIGMLTYRNYGILKQKQQDPDKDKIDNYKASAYILYQGEKLMNRFNAYSYWLLTKAMDSHHVARGRNKTTEEVLTSIRQNALIMGINSDILCPVEEQRLLFKYLPRATLVEIDSAYGHDGFLVETAKIAEHLGKWLDEPDDE